MTFKKLSDYFSALESTTSRLKITQILADLLKEASGDEVDKICYLSLGRLAPAYAGVEFNLAEKLMIKVLAQTFGESEEKLRAEFKIRGDLGDTAYQFKIKNQKSKTKNIPVRQAGQKLSVSRVYDKLMEIAQESGEGSVERKIEKMARLVSDLDPLSAKYVVRIPLGRLRLGFSELTILDSLSWMLVGNKNLRREIEKAYNILADVGKIAKEIKAKGSDIKAIKESLKALKPQLGVPIMPALCQRLPTPEEMIKKMVPRLARGKVAAEPKFDGTRLQAHCGGKEKVWLFTRNLENVTHMFPDIVGAISKEVKAKQVILDGETIGYDPKSGKFLPFQETIKRKRKHEIAQKAKEIPLKYFVFDILYKDGESLLEQPLEKRRQILEEVLSPVNQRIVLTPQMLIDNPSQLRKFHDEQIAKGLEGAVVKKWHSGYEPGRRGYNWVKFKTEKKGKRGGGLADTLDCVVMGYYKGRGKRAIFGIGAFLVGIREGENKFLTISKIGTGLTDEQWRELKAESQRLKVKSKPKEYDVNKNLVPDVWVAPGLVGEIEADNITISPVHTAGLALRFPRLLRLRTDKSPHQTTTLQEAKRLYQMQKT